MAETKVVTGDGGPAPAAPTPQVPQQQQPQQPPQQALAAPAQASPSGDSISWTASEFVSHEKSAGWYSALLAGGMILAAIIYIFTGDLISAAVIIIAAIAFAAIAGRRPRQLRYQIDEGGLAIGQKRYAFTSFKSFSVVPEGAFSSIVFKPLKRFAPLITIYYDPKDEEKIANLLSERLPYEEHKPDPVDNLMRRIRF